MRLQNNTLFDLGRTKCCQVSKVEFSAANGSGGDEFTQKYFIWNWVVHVVRRVFADFQPNVFNMAVRILPFQQVYHFH